MHIPSLWRRSETVNAGRRSILWVIVLALALTYASAANAAVDHVWAWGDAHWGRIGAGATTIEENVDNAVTETPVCAVGALGPCPSGPYLTGVTAISSGGAHSLALLSNGTVAAWGENRTGQLGDGTHSGPETCRALSGVHGEFEATRPCSAVPIIVSGLTGVIAVSAGATHSLALLSNGTVVAWGSNSSGQLGTGNTTEHDTPVPVGGLSNVVAVSAGAADSLALLSNGTVRAWGANESGQLGDGTTKTRLTPVTVSGLGGVTAIAAADGGAHSLALLGSGAVMAWGANGEGQLGDGTTTNSDVPVGVSGLSGVAAVAAAGDRSLALLGGGELFSWGDNATGGLGIGGLNEPSVPPFSDVPVHVCAVGVAPQSLCTSGPNLGGVTAISAAPDHSMALSGSTALGWGTGCSDQIGGSLAQGGEVAQVGGFFCTTAESVYIPVGLSGPTSTAKLIAAGERFSLSFGPPRPTTTRIYPTVGLTAGGEPVTITGSELDEATAVFFGSREAPSFTVNSNTSITAMSPAVPAGATVPVTVTTPAGSSDIVPGESFHFLASFPRPTIKVMKPNKGLAAGGTAVLIRGTGLFGGSIAVHFGSLSASEVIVNEIPSEPELNSLTAVSPPGSGNVEVTVTTLGGTSTTSAKTVFKYGAPVVTSVTPDSGPVTGGTRVTVVGSGFAAGDSGTVFKFATTPAGAVECSSTTTCTMLAPAHKAGAVDVIAVVGKQKSKKTPPGDRFTYG